MTYKDKTTISIDIENYDQFYQEVNALVANYLRDEAEQNSKELKIFFGENQYEKEDIDFKSIGVQIMSVNISNSKPFLIEKINGIVKTRGMHMIRRENGYAKGFNIDVGFTLDYDKVESSYKNLDFYSVR